jgi:RNA polymerase sigma-70 factor (ECF subfamily)
MKKMKKQAVRQNESALVCSARKGDKEALQTLIERNWQWLKGLVYSVTSGRPQEIDDIMQEVCLRLISKIKTLNEPERFKAWLAVLARNTAIRYCQKQKNKILKLENQINDTLPEADPARTVEQKETYINILDAVNGLPEKYRQVFILQNSASLSYSQIAEILDIPLTTVQIRLVRARKMILERLQKTNKLQGI